MIRCFLVAQQNFILESSCSTLDRKYFLFSCLDKANLEFYLLILLV